MDVRDQLTQSKRWVVKIGSALLTDDGRGLDVESMASWVDQMAELKKQGIEIVLVSSGSVAEGMTRLGWSKRPDSLHELQAAAAVGQMGLVQSYESNFNRHGYKAAQILLTHADFSNRQRYLNARGTISTLIEYGVIPVVNENDTVVTDEIRFGDNDTLAALVANLIDADALVILTDQDGLFDADPRNNPDAKLITQARSGDESLNAMAGDGGALGRGGMITKVRSAKLAARSGACTVIVGGRIPDVLTRLREGEELGTLLTTDKKPESSRKQWIAGHLQTKGTVVIDSGAIDKLILEGKSLLPVGIMDISGDFRRGEVVICVDESGKSIAKGLVNYSYQDAVRIIGCPSEKLSEKLGYGGDEEFIHRDNLTLV